MARFRQPGSALTAADVLAYAQRVSETRASVGGPNLCQQFVRMAFGSAGGAKTALIAWQNTPDKHTHGTPPPGAAVYWGGGAGHAAVSAGNGWVYSTDWSEPGKVDLVRIDDITRKWGKPLLGWTSQTNERRIIKFNAQPIQGKGSAGKQGVSYDPVYAGNGTTAGGDATTAMSQRELRERYGYAAEVYAKVPEIQKLITMARKGKWTETEFEHRVMASRWYKNHTEEEKQYLLLSTAQPAEAEQRIRQAKADVQNLYRNMGVPLGKGRLEEIAKASVVHGWTPQQIKNAVAAEFDYNPDRSYGGLAGQYLVPMSNKTLDQWTQNVLRGEATPESFTDYLKAQAKSLFPEIAPSIDKGVTVDQYLSPYREVAANTLGVAPDSIDWMDPKWSQLVFRTDPKTGERGVASLADAQRALRTDTQYGFDKTETARDSAAQFATKLANMFAGA